MLNILLKSASFVFLIILGYLLKRCRFFGPKDYTIPMKLVLNITLPAAVITSFSSYQFDLSLLLCTLIGFSMNWILLGISFLCSRNRPRASRAVWLNSVPGYNIGAFALPFVQSFFPASGVVACCLFDSGSALMCTGGTYAISSSMLGDKGSMSIKAIVKKLTSSLPFMTYLTMLILSVIAAIRPSTRLLRAGGNVSAVAALVSVGSWVMFGFDYFTLIGGGITLALVLHTVLTALCVKNP